MYACWHVCVRARQVMQRTRNSVKRQLDMERVRRCRSHFFFKSRPLLLPLHSTHSLCVCVPVLHSLSLSLDLLHSLSLSLDSLSLSLDLFSHCASSCIPIILLILISSLSLSLSLSLSHTHTHTLSLSLPLAALYLLPCPFPSSLLPSAPFSSPLSRACSTRTETLLDCISFSTPLSDGCCSCIGAGMRSLET